MFFQPSSDLRSDYGAFCETAGLSEREDVFQSIHTNSDEIRLRALLTKSLAERRNRVLLELGEAEKQWGQWLEIKRQQLQALDGDESKGKEGGKDISRGRSNKSLLLQQGGNAKSKGPQDSKRDVKGTSKLGEAPNSSSTSAIASRGKVRGDPQSVEAFNDATRTLMTAVEEEMVVAFDNVLRLRQMSSHLQVQEDSLYQSQLLSVLRLRYPVYCLNQRDIAPLCKAIPHCYTLVSVELTGCGLSEESYLLLVSALYQSMNIQLLCVDFNGGASRTKGFFLDPTIPSALTHRQSSLAGSQNKCALAAPIRSASPQTHSASILGSGVIPKPPPDRVTPCAPPPVSSAVRRTGNRRLEVFAVPSQYRSMHLQADMFNTDAASVAEMAGGPSTPSVVGVSGSRSGKDDKKGKGDAKKIAMQQQLRESWEETDRHLIPIPRGWHGALLTPIKELSLRGNNIDDAQVALLASALANHPRSELETLSLWGNKITDVGARAIADMLKVNRKLLWLNLGANQIGDDGLVALLECFLTLDVSPEDAVQFRKKFFSSILPLTPASPTEVARAAVAPPPPGGSLSPSSTGGVAGAATGAPAPSLLERAVSALGSATAPSLLLGNWSDDDIAAMSAASVAEVLPAYPTYMDRLTAWLVQAGGGAEDVTKQEGKKGAGAGGAGSKGKKQDGPMERFRLPFDRDCVRLVPPPSSSAAPGAPMQESSVLSQNSAGSVASLPGVGVSAGTMASATSSLPSVCVRVPGNFSLLGLYLGDNTSITRSGVESAVALLQRTTPAIDRLTMSCVPVQATQAGAGAGSNAGGPTFVLRPSIHTQCCPPPYCAVSSLHLASIFIHHRHLDPQCQAEVDQVLDQWRSVEGEAVSRLGCVG